MIALASIKLAMVLILKSLSESTGGKWVADQNRFEIKILKIIINIKINY